MCAKERQKGRQKERQRDRKRDRKRDREMERETEKETERETDKETERDTERNCEREVVGKNGKTQASRVTGCAGTTVYGEGMADGVWRGWTGRLLRQITQDQRTIPRGTLSRSVPIVRRRRP